MVPAIILLTIMLFVSIAAHAAEPVLPGEHQPHCILIGRTLCDALHDRPVAILMAAHIALVIPDGIYTHSDVTQGAYEADPVSRLLVGRRPTLTRMAPIGAVWIIGETYLAERMRKSKRAWVRDIAFVPQSIGIASSGIGLVMSVGAHR